MRKLTLCIAFMLMPIRGYGQLDLPRFKKEISSFEKALNGIASAILPNYGLTQSARSTYLEGYGPVFVMEVALERAANPFSTPFSPAEVKQNVERRHKEIIQKVSDLLKQKFSELKAAADSGTLTVVIYLWNTNPEYVPDLPSQIVFTAKKLGTTVEVAHHEFDFDVSRR